MYECLVGVCARRSGVPSKSRSLSVALILGVFTMLFQRRRFLNTGFCALIFPTKFPPAPHFPFLSASYLVEPSGLYCLYPSHNITSFCILAISFNRGEASETFLSKNPSPSPSLSSILQCCGVEYLIALLLSLYHHMC